MEVYLIPVGRDEYELYCEPKGGSDAAEDGEAVPGLIGRLRARFGAMIREAEERQRDGGGAVSSSWLARVRHRGMGWVANRIAEQRLLWYLRRESAVVAAHPQDMDTAQAIALIRGKLRRDFERHRLWLVIDAIGLLVSGPIALVPGPNVLAYYFSFRVFGHWLSMRGATQGLRRVAWEGRPCPPLSELRGLAALDPLTRQARIQDIGERLRLQHLATFFARVALRHA